MKGDRNKFGKIMPSLHIKRMNALIRGFSSTLAAIIALFFIVPSALPAQPSHLDPLKNPYTCAACHKGHGRRGTQMLRKDVPDLCFDCHSPLTAGLVPARTEVYTALQKRYRHPVFDTAKYHKGDEKLPEESPAEPRHVSCLDCHNAHVSDESNPERGVSGFSINGVEKKRADKESEICYKCHSRSVNRPLDSPDVMAEFDPSDPANRSYHPVERVARGQSISLVAGMSSKKMECTDCHDPHGSDYSHMLRFNYSETEGPETPYAYELCYSCHRRDSILADQSFRDHRRHISIVGAACNTCHAAHGSENARLIKFNPAVVSAAKTGLLSYSKTGKENSCFLNCHNVEHTGLSIERK